MSSSTNRILTLHKSRTTILELLGDEGYEVTDYQGFNYNEVEAMFKNDQLDMLVIRTKPTSNKVYVKYHFKPTLRSADIQQLIEDLFETSATLTQKDTLIIITDDDPNDMMVRDITYKFDKEGIFIIIYSVKRLQFNVKKHSLSPSAIHIMNDEEIDELKKKFHIHNLQQLPEISRFDPLAMSMLMRPGQIAHIVRDSLTAGTADYWRICI
jgi:DNA-directed RNA polymerase subunit H (RpoH/RPB5)